MKQIPLGENRYTTVSDEDYGWLVAFGWWNNGNDYAKASLPDGRQVYMHRVIMDAPDGVTVDHINGDGLDNQRENLRFATQVQQNMNRPKYGGKSRYKGVYRRYDDRKWVAQISVGDKTQYLGSFKTQEEAAHVYNQEAYRLHGEFAYLNNLGSWREK